MTVEVRTFSPTIPAGTLKAAPVTSSLQFPSRVVRRIDVRVPPGPRGELGFQVAVGAQQVIPYQAGQWLVMDDEATSWDLSNYPTTGDWDLIAYNTGAFDHTVYLRFFLDALPVPALLPPVAPVTVVAPLVPASSG